MSGILTGTGILAGSGILPGTGILVGSGILPDSFDPDALDYFARAEALGGTFSDPVKEAFNAYVAALKADSTWDQIDEIWPGCGVTWAGIAAKLKYDSSPVVSLTAFVTGDYTPTGALPGLKGNGLTKEINSNWSPSDTITAPNAHHSVFTTESAILAREGSYTDPDHEMSAYLPFGGTIYSDIFSENTSRITGAATGLGHVIFSTNATSHQIMVDGTSLTTGAAPTGSVPTADYYFFSLGATGFSDGRRAIRTMGRELSTIQKATLNTATQALMTAMGYAP